MKKNRMYALRPGEYVLKRQVKIPKDYATWDLLGFTDNIYSQC